MGLREESWLVPFFLENLKSVEIGFGCGIIILVDREEKVVSWL
jgi:hypothetical protein